MEEIVVSIDSKANIADERPSLKVSLKRCLAPADGGPKTSMPSPNRSPISVLRCATPAATAKRRQRCERPLFAKTLGEGHPNTSAAWLNLAGLEEDLGRWHEVEALLQKSLASLRTRYGPSHPRTVLVHRALGALWLRWHRFDEAAGLLRELLAVQAADDLSSSDPLAIARTLNTLGATLRRLENLEGAEGALRRAFEIRLEKLGADHVDTAISRVELAALDWHRGKPDLALSLSLFQLAELQQCHGDVQEGDELMGRALAMQRKILPEDHPLLTIDG